MKARSSATNQSPRQTGKALDRSEERLGAARSGADKVMFSERPSKLSALRKRRGNNGCIAASLTMIEVGLGDVDAARRSARPGAELAGNDAFSRVSLRSIGAIARQNQRPEAR